MTCLEKLKADNPHLSDEEILRITMKDCPGEHFDLGPTSDGSACDSFKSCIVCWYSEYPDQPRKDTQNGGNTLKIMLDPGAKMPTRAHPGDAGYDLYSPRSFVLPIPSVVSDGTICIDTGVHVAIPAGYVGMIKSKSGLNVYNGITSEGVIDSGYTGSIRVKLYNRGMGAVQIEAGQKISQLVILPIITPELELVDSLEETERGSGGFGSTGAF